LLVAPAEEASAMVRSKEGDGEANERRKSERGETPIHHAPIGSVNDETHKIF